MAESCFALGLFLFQEKQEGAKDLFQEAYALYNRYPRFSEDTERVRRVLEKFFPEELPEEKNVETDSHAS